MPIHANVTTYDWASLYGHVQFDAIMMDPPWQLATANPTRGVALGYSQLSDADIAALPIPALQAPGGLLLVWVINNKYKFALDLLQAWGYECAAGRTPAALPAAVVSLHPPPPPPRYPRRLSQPLRLLRPLLRLPPNAAAWWTRSRG